MAEKNGEIVGFASRYKDEVRAVYVHPNGRGLGFALLNAVHREAVTQDITKLRLSASLNAVSFYEAMGYRRLRASTVPCPNGVKLEAVQMEKILDPSLSGQQRYVGTG